MLVLVGTICFALGYIAGAAVMAVIAAGRK